MAITETERLYIAQYAKQHAAYERKVAPIFYKALSESVLPVIQTLNPNNIRKDVWQPAYQKAYRIIGTQAAMREYQYLKKTNSKDSVVDFLNALFGQRMSAYGAAIAFDFETDLTDTTLEQIGKAIEANSLNGGTNSSLARLIREYTLGTIGKQRSMLIARTESTTASNLAKIEGAKEYFKEIGENEGYKLWVTRMDGKERHDHMVINETAVPFNSSFSVGGFEGNVPGDPKLPAKERVRCRCTFVTLSEAAYRRRFG